ncbi:alpha/beta fold hydrolase [Micavibrio aeruginosavorus]|nr:alpha/beta fold hydrolase [Micavibrio aeruginosavorus]
MVTTPMNATQQNSPDGFERRPAALSIYLGAAALMLGPDADDAARQKHGKAMASMLSGIRKYQDHGYRRPSPAIESRWQAGTVRLLFYPSATPNAQPLLIIPSMINGSEILDILPDRSFTRWMAAQGFDVYLLDWGRMVDDPALHTMGGVIDDRVMVAVNYLHDTYGHAPHAIGYCMGGTLLAVAAALYPDKFNKMAFLSAPWDFHAGNPRMTAQVVAGAASALQMIDAGPTLPMDWVQKVFAAVNPQRALTKFASFLEMAADTPQEQMFIAVEDWLNGGHDLPSGVARVCIMDWYGHNRPVNGAWQVGDRTVGLDHLDAGKMMVVAAMRDLLVPPESALSLCKDHPDAAILRPDCGHISLMAGRNAMETVWAPLADWLKTG